MRKPRGKNRDNARRSKKKVSVLTQERVEYVDWKDVDLIRRFVSDRAKIRARRVTGNDAQQQRTIARAVKLAREMALVPYAHRVTQQRGGRRSEGGSSSGPPPMPDRPPRFSGGDDSDRSEDAGLEMPDAAASSAAGGTRAEAAAPGSVSPDAASPDSAAPGEVVPEAATPDPATSDPATADPAASGGGEE